MIALFRRYSLETGLALATAGLLLMQVCLTRLFSIVLWYHFGFLAVSTALLGFAAAGVWLALNPTPKDRAPEPLLARDAAVAAVAVAVCLWLVTQTTFDVFSIIQDRTVGVLLAFVLEVTVPFFFIGLVVARAISSFPLRVGSLYCADLVGAAAGCALAVLLLSLGVSAVHAILASGLLVAAAGVFFAAGKARGPLLASASAGAALLALLLFADAERVFRLTPPASKPLHRVKALEEHMPRVAATRALDGYLLPSEQPPWDRGTVHLTDGSTLEVETGYALTPDGSAFRVFTDDGPWELPVDRIARLPDGSLAFHKLPSWIVDTRWSTLARVDAFHWPRPMGPWGLWGLSPRYREEVRIPFPAQKGITIDFWAMTSAMRYCGGDLWPPGTPEVDEAREPLRILEYLPAGTVHVLRPRPASILCIGAGGGLDVLTAKYFGARRIVGVEINRHVVAATRDVFPDFAGRLYDPAAHPEIRVEVAEGRHFLERTHETFEVIQLSGVDTFSTSEAGAFSLSENYLYTVEAFQTYVRRLEEGGVITLTRWFVPAFQEEADGTERFLPRYDLRLLTLSWEGLRQAGVADPSRCIFYLKSGQFTVILLAPSGFSPEEVELLERHCARYGYSVLYAPDLEPRPVPVHGKPDQPNVYAAFVAEPDKEAFYRDYPFDVSPPTDDRPFYFEVSRFRNILQRDHYLNALGGLTAHGILVLILAEVLLLGLLFIVLPLRRLPRGSDNPRRSAGLRLGVLVYFSSLGLGFILVEIVLSQKFILFLGHPFHALAVILFSVLLFSGIGAGLSSRFPLPRLVPLVAALAALGAGAVFAPMFDLFLHHPLPFRIGLAVLALAPVGLALGMPFPVGVRALAGSAPELVPWAWGINGYTSVLGSVLAIVLGITLGFTMVLTLAACCYAVGLLGLLLLGKPAPPARQAPATSAPAFPEAEGSPG